MKSFIFLILSLLSFNTSFGQTINELDKKNGFREMKLGSSINEYKNLIRAKDRNFIHSWSEKDGIKIYLKENENLMLGDIKLKEIIYSFHNDKLYSIKVEIAENVGNELKYFFEDLFGSGFTTGTQRTNWRGERVSLVLYYPSPLSAGGHFMFRSLIIEDIMDKDKSDKIKKDF